MKNPNSPINRLKRNLNARWSQEDYPGGEPRFQLLLLAKDIGIFLCIPILAVISYKALESASSGGRKNSSSIQRVGDTGRAQEQKSQIIEFHKLGSVGNGSGFARKAPGTLVKVRLLNVVETFATAPVHVQIIDRGLGDRLLGGTLIGDANPDTNFERINIAFRYARDPNRDGVAAAISARALGLDGTLGLEARKKEGFFARAVASSAHGASQEAQGQSNESDFKQILFRALTAGLVQEFGNNAQVEKNRSQVLMLAPSVEFFVELTDFFPGASK